MDAVSTENAKRGTYFIQKEKEVEAVISTTNEKVFQSLYWLCKNEVAHSKLNSLLELVESLGVEEVVHFSKRSSTVLRKLLILIGDQVNEDLLGKIKKSPFFGLLTDEIIDITNIQNLVTFIKFYESGKTAFINSTDLLAFSESGSADAKSIHDCL